MKRSSLVGRLKETSFINVSPQANEHMASETATMARTLPAAVVPSSAAGRLPRPSGSLTPASPAAHSLPPLGGRGRRFVACRAGTPPYRDVLTPGHAHVP